MKLNIAFSVQSGCLNLLSRAGSTRLSCIRKMRSAACLQTVIPSLNRPICAFATATGSLPSFSSSVRGKRSPRSRRRPSRPSRRPAAATGTAAWRLYDSGLRSFEALIRDRDCIPCWWRRVVLVMSSSLGFIRVSPAPRRRRGQGAVRSDVCSKCRDSTRANDQHDGPTISVPSFPHRRPLRPLHGGNPQAVTTAQPIGL